MRTKLRKIGNSRGLILPAPLLAACGIESEVELRIEGRSLVLDAARNPRAGWFDLAPAAYADDAAAVAADWDAVADDGGEWEW
jgi:antitoxin MazE